MIKKIYIKMIDEGTNVFRPAFAEKIDVNMYQILFIPDFNPEDESLEFNKNSIVGIYEKKDDQGRVFYVAKSVSNNK